MKIRFVFGSFFILVASSTYAMVGPFVGGQLGFSNTDIPGSYKDHTYDDAGGAFNLNMGYNLTNYFGAELDLDKYADILTVDPYGVQIVDTSYWQTSAMLNAYLPVYQGAGYFQTASLFAKGGLAYVYQTTDHEVSGAESNKSFWRPKISVGAEFYTTQNWSTSVQYTRVFGQGDLGSDEGNYLPSFNFYSIGFTYYFGFLGSYYTI